MRHSMVLRWSVQNSILNFAMDLGNWAVQLHLLSRNKEGNKENLRIKIQNEQATHAYFMADYYEQMSCSECSRNGNNKLMSNV